MNGFVRSAWIFGLFGVWMVVCFIAMLIRNLYDLIYYKLHPELRPDRRIHKHL